MSNKFSTKNLLLSLYVLYLQHSYIDFDNITLENNREKMHMTSV